MAKVEADIEVKSFGYDGDGNGRRLLFPNATTQHIEGRSGSTTYGAAECHFDKLEGRLDTLRWKAEAASAGGAFLHDDAGRFDVKIDRAEFPRGLLLTRAVDYGIELLSPQVTFHELKLTVNGPFGRKTDGVAPPRPPKEFGPNRQDRLRFLDSLSGRLYTTLKVQLDLPVIGLRTLDQALRVPIQEGSLDYRALDSSLDWLEGTFLDIKHEKQLLKLQWKVPIVGVGHDLITWALDQDASTLASFGRVPLRSLADFRTGSGKPVDPTSSERSRKGGTLKSLTLDKIDIALSLLAPRHLDVGGGTIMFGGEDQPGMVDMKVTGAIRDRGPGALKGAIGSIDTTIKDLELGPVMMSADRLHFDSLDQLEVAFDGFTPSAFTMVIHRVTATNLAIKIGHRPQPPVPPPSARSSSPAVQVDRTPPR